jgi:hypothetical protein
MEAVRQITGLDLGRELFANIEQLTLFMLPPTTGALNHPLAREFRPIPVSIGLAIASRDPGKTRMVVDTLLSVVTQVFNIQNNIQSETKDDGPVRKYAFGPVSEQEPRLCLYMAEAGESTVFSIDPNVVDAARRAVETGQSALTAGPLSEPLQRLESDTSKLVLVNAGGLATALFGADTQVPQEARGMISSIAFGLRDTTVRLQTREGANHFALRIGVDRFSGQALNSLLFPFIRIRQSARETVEAQMHASEAELRRDNGIRDSVGRAKADMRSIAVALEAYNVDNNSYPLPMDESSTLVEPPPQGKGIVQGYVSYLLNTPIRYVGHISSDPFGGDKTYRYALYRPMGWILASPGPDGVMNADISAYLDQNKADRNIEKFLSHYGQGGEFIQYDPSNGTVSPGDIFLVGP